MDGGVQDIYHVINLCLYQVSASCLTLLRKFLGPNVPEPRECRCGKLRISQTTIFEQTKTFRVTRWGSNPFIRQGPFSYEDTV